MFILGQFVPWTQTIISPFLTKTQPVVGSTSSSRVRLTATFYHLKPSLTHYHHYHRLQMIGGIPLRTIQVERPTGEVHGFAIVGPVAASGDGVHKQRLGVFVSSVDDPAVVEAGLQVRTARIK